MTSKLLPSSTSSGELGLLQEAVREKKELISVVGRAQEILAYCAGVVSQSTLPAQNVLTQASVAVVVPSRLNHLNPANALDQLKELLRVARMAKAGEVDQAIASEIANLQKNIGEMEAATEQLEQEIPSLDVTIAKLHRLIQERQKTLRLSQVISGELG